MINWKTSKHPEVSGFESSELSKDNGNGSHALEKSNANQTLDKGLKMLKEANRSALFLKINDRFENPSFQPESATKGSQKKMFVGRLLPYKKIRYE